MTDSTFVIADPSYQSIALTVPTAPFRAPAAAAHGHAGPQASLIRGCGPLIVTA